MTQELGQCTIAQEAPEREVAFLKEDVDRSQTPTEAIVNKVDLESWVLKPPTNCICNGFGGV